ncbi:MAG: type II secretion system ATPase GspE [Pseudomonadota bacterium]|nr:type II secretion system ATPase GspE [Pseudomonadota bacterium]
MSAVEAPEQSKVLIPFAYARRNGLFVREISDGHAVIWQRPDADLTALAAVRARLNLPLRLQQVDSAEFERELQHAYESDAGVAAAVIDTLDQSVDLADLSEQLAEPEDLLESADDAPIIRLINAILTEAVKEGASDIHIESFEKDMRIRFRVDGVLREVLRPKAALGPLLVSRVKVMGRLDIAEKRLPQDGRISLRIAGRPVDVRVSTLPSGHGERVVLRLLDKQAGRLDLRHIGLRDSDQQRLDRIIHRPHGIVLVTGPTGSGKTTTLYAALTRLNELSRNIMTVEDPIEYFLEGISQTAVNTKVEMSFARGLRAILRQDPDVIMVGEIRDLETARIAVQASLTGHLVLSTLHTNTAIGAVTRLVDMGVEPYLIASSVLATVAQRLVRVLCEDCKQPTVADVAACVELGVVSESPPTLFEPRGCPLCNHTGFRGRTGIYEVIEIDAELRDLIHDNVSEPLLERAARAQTPSIRADGIEKVLAGITSLDEVMRVTRQD